MRRSIARTALSVWGRMMRRREHMTGELSLELAPEALPLSDTEGYARPFALGRACALRAKRAL